MFFYIRSIVIISGLIFITSCTTQKNISLSENFWKNPKHKIVVATTTPSLPAVYKGGPQGVLDLAISNAMNNSLNQHMKTRDLSWYQNVASRFAGKLKQHGISAEVYKGQIKEDERNNYAGIKNVGGDNLLVIQLKSVGAIRHYYGFIPLDAPQGYCVITGKLINTKNNQVLWRYQARMMQPVQGVWDQPPHYPSLDNAMRVAVNSAQQELLDSFFSGH